MEITYERLDEETVKEITTIPETVIPAKVEEKVLTLSELKQSLSNCEQEIARLESEKLVLDEQIVSQGTLKADLEAKIATIEALPINPA